MGHNYCHEMHEYPPTVPRHPIRAFDPWWNELYRGRISDIIKRCRYCDDYELRVKCPRYRGTGCGSVVAFTDGACRNNGRYGARAGLGVFYGPRSDWNSSALLAGHISATNQNAEIYAAMMAVQDMIDMDPDGERDMCKLLIITDSKYVVDGISRWIWRWKRNGWRTANGTPVTSRKGFERLDRRVRRLEERGIDVWFWHVPRELNRDADRLANEALD